MNQYPLISLTLFIMMFGSLPLSLVLLGLNICTANGSTMFGNNIGSISTSKLLVPVFFNVTKLSYNLFSVGQLNELGYHITFDYSGCTMQDPRMG